MEKVIRRLPVSYSSFSKAKEYIDCLNDIKTNFDSSLEVYTVKISGNTDDADLNDFVNAIKESKVYISLDLSESLLKVVHEEAFDDCTKLKDIKLPDGLKRIKARAFRHCISLKTIKTPESVTDIEEQAFNRMQ